MTSQRRSPRESFITVYGRKPVEEVLLDNELEVDKIILADNIPRNGVRRILTLAKQRGVRVESASAQRVKLLAGNGKHDQGVVADVVAPGLRSLAEFCDHASDSARVFVLDHVTTPANVGMIIRSATGAGIDGLVLPTQGTAALGPLVIKASAGIAYRATIVRARRTTDALEHLSANGFTLVGLTGGAPESLLDADFDGKVAFVLGNETEGISGPTLSMLARTVSIPMRNGVESLNVSAAAAVAAFAVRR